MDIYLYGCGGHAKVVLDTLYEQGKKVKALIDDNPPLEVKEIYGIPIRKSSLELFHEIDCECSQWIVAIGNNAIRKKITQKLEYQGYFFTTAIHPSARVSRNVEIGAGTVIMPNAVINTDSNIGQHVIINTCATIEHDCQINDYCHVAPRGCICGNVKLGESVFLGAGTQVIPGICIGDNTTCGAGSVVVKSLPSSCLAYGCPATVKQTDYS